MDQERFALCVFEERLFAKEEIKVKKQFWMAFEQQIFNINFIV